MILCSCCADSAMQLATSTMRERYRGVGEYWGGTTPENWLCEAGDYCYVFPTCEGRGMIWTTDGADRSMSTRSFTQESGMDIPEASSSGFASSTTTTTRESPLALHREENKQNSMDEQNKTAWTEQNKTAWTRQRPLRLFDR